jgi:starch phosphorylase
VEERWDARGRFQPTWVDYTTLMAVPYDMPVVGYGCNTVNLLRLWAARAPETFDLETFNRGGFVEAVHRQAEQETISKVLYPHDQHERGRELRLIQQYFFVAATLSDVLRRYDRTHDTLDALPDKVAVQLNDTHPSLAVAELMRILVDERGQPWERAWDLTVATLGYTNHTLMPEALERWPVELFGRLLPRHLQIVYEINRRFLADVGRRWPHDVGRLQRMSLIEESPVRSVRMAHLAIVGSHAINGVAALHSELIRKRLAPDFAELWPERFSNKTNGVTPRRWLLACNPGLAAAITRRIGAGWVRDLERLRGLETYADDPVFQAEFLQIKRANKEALAGFIRQRLGLKVAPEALFDVQVKRLHEYKRQLLNILQVVVRYQRIVAGEQPDPVPRVVLFGAKAAPAYGRAKLIIKLINDVARTVNHDPRVGEALRVCFIPNYRVSLAELIIPAADLSEQISTAGTEASGTGNMKFALNGALTIGTLDGANIEIRAAVGAENFFLFGLREEEVAARRGRHDPLQVYGENRDVRRALDAVAAGEFNPAVPGLFQPVLEWLTREGDPYFLLADIESYLAAQSEVDRVWRMEGEWARRAILNVARVGAFSSDRTIREYAEEVWGLKPTVVRMGEAD